MNNAFKFCWVGLLLLLGIKSATATQLSGTVTINPGGTASGTVFKNYNSLISYLAGSGSRTDGGPSNTAPFGLSGNLTVNVVVATITDRVNIPSTISGLGNYQLKFLGASKTGTILQYATKSVTDSQYVVRISGAKNVAFENMTIKSTAAVSNSMAAVGIHIMGNSPINSTDDIEINNCVFIMPAQNSSAYSTYVAGVAVNGTNSLSLGTGGYAKKIRITNNNFNFGYYNLYLRGASNGTSSIQDATVTGNTFSYGYFYALSATYANNLNFSNNSILQDSISSAKTSYGLYLSLCSGFSNSLAGGNGGKTSVRNNIFNSVGAYGIYFSSTSGQTVLPNEVTGNVVLGNLRNVSGNYYPMYFSSCNYTNIAHNTAAVNWGYSLTSYGVLAINAGNYLKVYNNTFLGYGTSNAVYLTSTITNCTIDYNNFYNYSDQTAIAPVMYYSGTGTVYHKSNFQSTGAAAVNAGNAGMNFGSNNVFVNQGWAGLTNLVGSYSCVKGASLSVAEITTPSQDINGIIRSEIEPSIGAYEIGNNQPNYFMSKVTALDQNNNAGPVFDTISDFTISAYIHRGNISQATRYTASLFQNNVPLVQENFIGSNANTCEIDTLVFQYHPNLSSGSVTYKIVIDSINGKSLDSIPLISQSNSATVAVSQRAIIDKSVNRFNQLPLLLKGNTPDPGNWVRWRKISLVPGTLEDSLQSTATYTGSRGSYHRVSYTISNNLTSNTDTFEFYIANCPTGFSTDSLHICQNSATLNPGTASTYLWNTGDTTATLTVNQSGWYSVTLQADSCTITDSIFVQLVGPKQNQYVLDTLETCPGLGLTLWGTNYSPLVSQMGNAANRFQYVADTGHFQKVLINQWGCDSTITLNVIPLNYQELRLDTHACSLDGNFLFQGNQIPVNADTVYVLNSLNCQQYYKVGLKWDGQNQTISTELNSCQNTIALKPQMKGAFENISSFVSSLGDSILATDTSSSFNFQVPGHYSIGRPYQYKTLGTWSGCDAFESVTISKETIISSTDTTICFGIPIQISANPTRNWVSYRWSNGDTTSTTTANAQISGNYLNLWVSDGFESCADSIRIYLHSKITNLPFDTTTQVNKPYTLDVAQYQSVQAQSYNWSNGNQSSIGRIYNAGWNSVTSVFANSCAETDSIFVVFNDGIAGTSNEGRINYQAQIAFSNAIRANRSMAVRFSITHDQTTDFAETQTLTTDAKGMIHTLIGSGLAQVGTLNDVTWEDGKIRMLKVEVDTTGQNQWISLGSSRLVSVPYAEYARTSGDGSRDLFGIFDANGQNLGSSGVSILPQGNGIFEIGYEKSFQNEPVISIELVGSGNYTKRILFSDAQKCRIEIGGNPNKVHVSIHGK